MSSRWLSSCVGCWFDTANHTHTHLERRRTAINCWASASVVELKYSNRSSRRPKVAVWMPRPFHSFIHSFIHCALGCSGLHRALSSFSFLPFQTICSIRAAANGNVNAVLYRQTNIAMAEQWRWGAYGEWESRKRLGVKGSPITYCVCVCVFYSVVYLWS